MKQAFTIIHRQLSSVLFLFSHKYNFYSYNKSKQILSFMVICVYSMQIHGQISVNKRTADLGTITTAKPIKTEFIVYNKSTSPLTLNSVTTSSGLLIAKYSKKPIAPNDSCSITTTLHTQDLPSGIFRKPIRIKCNGEPSTFNLFIAGNVSNEIPSRQYRNDHGFAWVKLFENGKYGAEVAGKRIIAPIYKKNIYNVVLQRFLCSSDNMFTLTDTLGNKLFTSMDVEKYSSDKKGLVLTTSKGQIYIDKTGYCIIGSSRGYNYLDHIFKDNAEYFRFNRNNMSGILDKNGKVLFETPTTYEEEHLGIGIGAYYINGCAVYVTSKGIYDYHGNQVVKFNFVPKNIFEQPIIDDKGDIYTYIKDGYKKIGSIKDFNFPSSANPFL